MNCANHPDRERKAFCQNCGKPLCTECARTVGQAVFCEPCLEARLTAANVAAGAVSAASASSFGGGPTTGSASYQTVPGGGTAYRYTGTAEGIPYEVRGVRPAPGTPNPGVAFLLGLIPGVGAMYNGQYAKGVVHLIVFAILVSLADQNSIFGLFVTAWIFYQAIEAYHTARARRDGTLLPNPFGLNDIGERFGFGRSWPGSGSAVPGPAPVAPGAASPGPAAGTPPGSAATAANHPPPASAYGAPYAGSPYAADPVPPASWGAPVDSYGTVPPPPAPVPPMSAGPSFPVGAIVLIGLGVLFLVGNASWFGTLPVHLLLPFLLIGVGVWIFVRRMTSTGVSLVDDGTPAYRLRLVRALQSSIWVVLVGVLFLLDNLHILSWGRSWPLFIIVGGVMAFVQRSVYSAWGRSTAYTPYVSTPPGAAAPPTPAPGSSIVPSDREGD